MTYNSKSCSSLEKAYYTPVEAALRWCNLIDHEISILERVGGDVLPGVGMFPQWPCLRVNAEKILDAIQNNEIPYGRDGKTVKPGEQVAKHRLTVRHSDLKSWMSKNYPNQKPDFLFDAVEQQLHAGITVEAYQTLQAENKRLNIRLADAVKTFRQQKSEISALQGERDSLRQMVNNSVQNIDQRSETTYLNIIGGLLSLMLGCSPAGVKQSVFENQSSIISSLLGHFGGKQGISARTLEAKFAEANKSIKS
ncbi:protein kinase [Escherichia coli]|uniref:protein kinase n=1 Tax=Escherichia coli TaxID=562 RepID=UPI00201CB285|nr:protein kinase [Escherichia coli]